MKKTVLFILGLLGFLYASAQDKMIRDILAGRQLRYYFYQKSAIKVYPSFYKTYPRGGGIQFEKGLGEGKFSVQVSARYFSGIDTSETPYSVPAHGRLEIQPRLWLVYDQGLFAGPIVGLQSTGDLTGGASFGYSLHYREHLVAEFSIGAQFTTIEEFLFPVYIRYGLSLGYYWKKSKEKKNDVTP